MPADQRDDPLLSVVVPVYDVEDYLAECLDSILAQTWTQLEVIVVDDGSRDSSAEIAAEYVRRDARVRLVSQPNAGLGAARNTGVANATAPFLVFADSDDTVPHQAYALMMGTLLATGSDFVLGAMAKQFPGEYRIPAWLVPLHRHQRHGVGLDAVPEALLSVFAWNKLFRRSFWDAARLSFPEGVSYEDHVPMSRAYLTARAFDVIPDVVYRWRIRDDGRSITQRKQDLDNLRDALEAKRGVSALVAELGSATVRRHWHRTLFNDLRPYIDCVPTASEDYWATLHQGVAEFVDAVPVDDFEQVAVRNRLLCWLVARGRRADVEAALTGLGADAPPAGLVRRRDGEVVLELPFLDPVALPPDIDVQRLAIADRRLRARLVALGIEADGCVAVRVRVQLLGVVDSADPASVALRLTDRRSGTQRLVPASVERAPEPNGPDRPAGSRPPLLASARIEPDRFGATVGSRAAAEATWGVDLVVRIGDVSTEGPVTGVRAGVLDGLAQASRAGPGSVVAQWTAGPGLELVRRRGEVTGRR